MKNLLLFVGLFVVSLVSAQSQRDSITFDPQKQLNAAQSILSGNFGKNFHSFESTQGIFGKTQGIFGKTQGIFGKTQGMQIA